jgi:fluoroquinolone transport system permease protein
MMAQVITAQTRPAARPASLPRTLWTMLRNDARLIGRNSFLSGLIGYIIIMALVLRFGLPALADGLANNPDVPFDIAAYFPMLIGYIVIFVGAMVSGMVIGFIVLDERDDNTIKALLVSPLPLGYYLAYRVFVPMLLGFAIIVAEMLIINLALVPLWQLLLIAAAGSLTGPLVMLFFASFAQNKVQGFAMNKIVGTLGLVIFAAWFVQPPLQYLIGLFPPYWFVKAYWLALADDANWLLALVIGVAWSSVVLALFVRRFRQVVYQ